MVPGGGYFLWLTLGDDVDCVELLAAALEEGVAFVAGPDFMLDGGRSSLRLSFASVPAERIPEGVERIAGRSSGSAPRARPDRPTLLPRRYTPLTALRLASSDAVTPVEADRYRRWAR